MKALGIFGLSLLAAPAPADPFEEFGTAMKYGLPAAAAFCALEEDRIGDFAVRGLVQAGIVLALKEWMDEMPIAMRPSGEGRGFPSGHSAAAAFGAADLAGKCFDDSPAAGLGSYALAGLTAASRVHAGEHDLKQVMSGALIGFSFGAASFGIGREEVRFSIGLRF